MELRVVSRHGGGEVVHAAAAHHAHAAAVAPEPGVHPGQEPPEPGVTLLLGLLGQLAVPSLDVVLLQCRGSRDLQWRHG